MTADQAARRQRYAIAIHDAMEPDLSLVDQEPAYQALIARAAEAAMALADADRASAKAAPVADLPARLEAVLTERYTELGNQFAAMRYHEQGPDGWPASHPVGPHHVAKTLRELLAEGKPTAPANACDKCAMPFDPADTRHDGRAQHAGAPYCKGCVDRCHESTDAFHVCDICRDTAGRTQR